MSFGIIIRGENYKKRYWTNEKMRQAFGNLEDHEYRHENRSLGMVIKDKEQFREILEKGGYVSQEDGERLAEQQRKETRKDYKGIEKKTMRAIADLKATSGKDGKLSSLEGTKRACEEVGIKFDYYNKLPKHYDKIKTGGFHAEER